MSNFFIPNWPVPSHIKSIQTLRAGGKSEGKYKSFNLATHVNDDIDLVNSNRELIDQFLPSSPHWLHQTHSVDVIELPSPPLNADASYTKDKNIVCAVQTADCLPLLATNKKGTVVAAIHAGWKGTVLRIIRKTLCILRDKFKCDKSDIMIGLGPSIGKCCYEVDRVVLDPLFQNLPWATEFVVPYKDISASNDLKRRLDLAAINQSELIKFGIYKKNIYKLNMCTSCNVSDLHSFRRDGASSGRSIAITGFRS